MPPYNGKEQEPGLRRFLRARSFIWQDSAETVGFETLGISANITGLISVFRISEPESVDEGVYLKKNGKIVIQDFPDAIDIPADPIARQITIFEFKKQSPGYRVIG